jgi:hypothetical protein
MVEVLGHASGKPVVELLTGSGGERFPLPLGLDDSYAFDHGLPRVGWVAVHVGYQVAALRDGDLFHASRLPDAWSLAPAADPTLVLARRYFGRSRQQGEPETIELVDAFGATLRSVTAEVDGVAGELRTGVVVCRDRLLAWDGTMRALGAPGRAEAVVGGRYVVLLEHERARVRLFDPEAERTVGTSILPPLFLGRAAYNADASAVAVTGWNSRDVLVADAEGAIEWFTVGFDPHSAVWTSKTDLLLVGDRNHCSIDVPTGAQSSLEGFPRRAYPRVDVSGRFDLEELRAATRPPWTGPVSEEIRSELMERSRARIRAAADHAGLASDPLDAALAAIRIRSCVPPKQLPVGASRLGGRPDLPVGTKWPSHRNLPMAFLCQLRCDELGAALPDRDVPPDGLLLVFAAIVPEDANAERAHVEVVPTAGLRRRPWPKGLPHELRYSSSLAVAEPVLSHPDWHVLRETSPEAAVERFRELVRLPGPEHQLFGHPATIQDTEPPSGYELLMQFDGDSLIEASFADGGRLHFWWRAGSSLTGVIEDCVVEMECF